MNQPTQPNSPFARRPFTPPRIITYTDDELLEAIGPALANNSQVGPGLFGPSTPGPYDPESFFAED